MTEKTEKKTRQTTMKKHLLLAMLAFFGCQKKHGELDFFEVRLDGQPAFLVTEKALLRAEIFNSTDGGAVDECGFFVSESLAETDTLRWPFDISKLKKASPPASGNGAFEAEIDLQPARTFFVKAFARRGERVAISQTSVSIGFPALVSTDLAAPRVLNDGAWPRGQLLGLAFLDSLRIVEHGHVFSSKNPLPTIGAPDCSVKNLGPAAADGSFESPLEGLEFNADHWARAYVRSASGAVFYAKEAVQFRIRGGWRRVADFPTDYFNGSAGAFGGEGLASFGVDSQLVSNPADYPRAAWAYRPATDEWSPLAPYSTDVNPVFPHTNAAAAVVGSRLFAVSGEYKLNDKPLYLNSMMAYDFGAQSWQYVGLLPFKARTGAVAFSLNGKMYVGSGECFVPGGGGQKGLLNDFWEFDPPTDTWRPVASLPIKTSVTAAAQNAGRREASVFCDGQQAWVGGGISGGANLRDFWLFESPASAQDTGRWVNPTFTPVGGRFEAVSLSADGRFFYGLGFDGVAMRDDWWQFDPTAVVKWKKQNAFPGGPRRAAMAFSIAGRGFVGTGLKYAVPDLSTNEAPTRDFWMFVPDEL